MTHEKPFGAALHHAVQFACDRLRIVFERRTNGVAGKGDAADQNSRCDEISDQLYDMRRRLRGLNAALEETVPPEIRERLLTKLSTL